MNDNLHTDISGIIQGVVIQTAHNPNVDPRRFIICDAWRTTSLCKICQGSNATAVSHEVTITDSSSLAKKLISISPSRCGGISTGPV